MIQPKEECPNCQIGKIELNDCGELACDDCGNVFASPDPLMADAYDGWDFNPEWIAEVIKEEAEVTPNIQDTGIGPYEYWGCPGNDVDWNVVEVEARDVFIALPYWIPTERLVNLTVPVITTSHTAEGDRARMNYEVKWTGKLTEDKRHVIYSAGL